jgi:hypothetical protein
MTFDECIGDLTALRSIYRDPSQVVLDARTTTRRSGPSAESPPNEE